MKIFNDKSLVFSIVTGLVLLLTGAFYMLSNWMYSEDGHSIILLVYIVCAIATMMTLRFRKTTYTLSLILIMVSALVYANLKFEWRKDYITSANNSQFFLLDQYVDSYPLFEEYIFSNILGKSNYIDFSEQCFARILNNEVPARQCRSLSLIEKHYNLNPKTLIDNHFQKMKRTAQSVERGSIKTKRQFQNCYNNNKCAVIPLLPAGVDVEAIDPQGKQYIETRKMFWSLVNDNEISPEICDFMALCSAMRKIGVIAIESIPDDGQS